MQQIKAKEKEIQNLLEAGTLKAARLLTGEYKL